MVPRMIVVAGPPGSGKSTLYPVSTFGVSYFNADDRAAELNGGSYVSISNEIRKIVNREFEAFVLGSIEKHTSFAIETTLRSDVTFEQARIAKQAGFVIEMRYIALRDFDSHLERVKARADAGGHSASPPCPLPFGPGSRIFSDRTEIDRRSTTDDHSGLGDTQNRPSSVQVWPVSGFSAVSLPTRAAAVQSRASALPRSPELLYNRK